MTFSQAFLAEVDLLLSAYELDKEEGSCTLEELIERVEFFQGGSIAIHDAVALPYSVSGFVVRSKTGNYHIFVDAARRTAAEKRVVITHELAHIMRGDVSKLVAVEKDELLDLLAPGEGPSSSSLYSLLTPERVACRQFDHEDENEKKIEYIAFRIRERLLASNHQNLDTLLGSYYRR